MGVTGLWKLVEPCGQPIPLEMLENKVLAVDISIWLHQVVKGFQDNKGSALANAHLLGLFHRLCKLMYYRIKPVFVFDGKVPLLKKETIAKRNQKRNRLLNEADRIQALLLQSLAKEKVVQQALGVQAANELLKVSPLKKKALPNKPDVDDIFKLPDLPMKNDENEERDLDTTVDTSSTSDANSSMDEPKRNYYNKNLQAIDVKSQHFRSLPADIRHEILIDIKETRKQSSWGKLNELPSKGSDFSVFQMKRLLKRRQVQVSLEEVEKEMDGVRTFTMSELESIFSEEGIIEPTHLPNTKRISSDENTRFLLVRDLKKTLEATVKSEKNENQPETSTAALEKIESFGVKEEADVAEEDDVDLQKAIQMSLDESTVYSEKDYEYTERYKLNKDQRKNLQNAAVGLARAYMIEHAGMNDDEVHSLLDSSQNSTFVKEMDLTLDGMRNECESENLQNPKGQGDLAVPLKQTVDKTVVETADVDITTDHSNDSDLEEVIDCAPPSNVFAVNSSDQNQCLEIVVDVSKEVEQSEDLFADVFSTETAKIDIKPPSAINATEILDTLKKQASEITQIKLNDIKLDPQIIEAADDESQKLSQCLVYETDSVAIHSQGDEISAVSRSVSSPIKYISHEKNLSDTIREAVHLNKVNLCTTIEATVESKEVIEIIDDDAPPIRASPNLCTPSKAKTINEFFETKYVIKRTPEKSEEVKEDVPYVKSPFFHRKISNSGSAKKRGLGNDENDSTSPKKLNKAAKMLFEESDGKGDGVNPIIEEENVLSVAEVAVNILKETKTQEELKGIASHLAKDKKELEIERNRQDRMGMSITEKMNLECMQLLRLFGVPYIIAPMEAEAQCAFLDAMQLTNGTITDDSDIWLFGGRTVYKNFFAQNKHVMEFRFEKIENSFHVNRQKLIQFALLVGSDYTTGINGIGAVTALEILATFNTIDDKNTIDSEQIVSVWTTLRKFRDWWAASTSRGNSISESSARHKLRNKLKNIELSDGFPNKAVIEAYLQPTVDDSKETFSWGSPDVESIREFTRTNFGWTRVKTDEILGPVLKRLNERKSQATIKNYFAIQSTHNTKQLPVSKRVQNAISKMSTDYKSDEETNATKAVRKSKQRKRKQPVEEGNSNETKEDIPKKTSRRNKYDSTRPISSTLGTNPTLSSDIIPQREKDLEEMERKKQLAATVLKKLKTAQIKK